MAINPIDIPCNKTGTLSHSCLNHYKHGNSPASCLFKRDFMPAGSISNLSYKYGTYKNNLDMKSPYLRHTNHPMLGDVQLLSRVTEKRIVHKNGTKLSSFPLAGNIYKTNSDEFKGRQTTKKVLKSVLTLPNNSSPITQFSMGSDMNDSECASRKDDVRRRPRKRNTKQFVPKYRNRSKGLESESQYGSGVDIKLVCSSTETLKKSGDGGKNNKSINGSKEKVKPHDVWAVLRNMNRFQFQPSPHISEDSFMMGRQKKSFKRRHNRKDMRVFETRRTEEIAYISSYKVDKSPTMSRCSSFDKITVIDQSQDLKAGRGIDDKTKRKKTGKFLGPNQRNQQKSTKRNNIKALSCINQLKNKKKGDVDNTGKINSFLVNPNAEDENDVMFNSASIDLGYESKTTENDEDFTSLDMNTTTTQTSQFSQSKLSDYSGSSKAAFTKQTTLKKVKPKLKADCNKQINGITRVILKGQNKEQIKYNNKSENPKRNLRSLNQPNCPTGPPKLTKTEINRQLQKYKFPVIVLGKDQLRSSIQVVNSEFSQFDGLEQQIWPFMNSWHKQEQPSKVTKTETTPIVCNKKTKNDKVEKKIVSKNMTKTTQLTDNLLKVEHKRVPQPLSEIINQSNQNQRKLKPIRELKDKMLKLLYKHSSILSVIEGSPNASTDKNQCNLHSVNACTGTRDKYDRNTKKCSEKAKELAKPSTVCSGKRSWSKAKWASDFIENVIKKIKSGAYYNQDVIHKVHIETMTVEQKEVDVQTESITNSVPKLPAIEPTKEIAIPGFDNILPVLEIKKMSINEVAVKHCGSNILVHFDVAVPSKSTTALKKDSSLIPIDITQSMTKVFRCQTSILNAMLPAELCSILPKLMSEILDSRQHLPFCSPPTAIPCLTTVSKFKMKPEVPSLIDIPTAIPPFLPTPRTNIVPLSPMMLKLQQLLILGYYKTDISIVSKFHVVKKIPYLAKYNSELVEEMMPQFGRPTLFDIESQLTRSLKVHQGEPKILPIVTFPPSKEHNIKACTISQPIHQSSKYTALQPIKQINTCTALQPYPGINHSPVPFPKPFSIMHLIESMAAYINNIGHSCIRMIKADNNVAMNMNMGNNLNNTSLVMLQIANLRTHHLKDSPKRLSCAKITVLSDTDETVKNSIESINNYKSQESYANNNKNKKKGYVKLYRKCKSYSNLPGEKVTPLNKISNLDDFFQALGSAKLLSSVFDGLLGNKIMESIKELKNWTTEINPRQALLVILLANKKETSNLMRYRPMLLQGIAVNRITKAIELDMEIEVIERENLNGISRFEGISYLPASIENQDSLYDELCWIAKNTASDYQKPFDHNSEKLLKSLLEKRKQLNPSYLRVMARYVGLGLLKSPGRRH